jgi:hypothetical protein
MISNTTFQILMLHFSGIAYGMVELICRVIPRDIVGGHVGKLKRMDAVVHGEACLNSLFRYAKPFQ